jgi:alkylation response protein AidB-like acyl-CoA dehydrogenase
MSVLEAYGSNGLNIVEHYVVIEELSKRSLWLYQAEFGLIELGPGLTVGEPAAYFDCATPNRIDRFFGPCIEGEKRSCFGLTGLAVGPDPRGMETSARRDGDEWVHQQQETLHQLSGRYGLRDPVRAH